MSKLLTGLTGLLMATLLSTPALAAPCDKLHLDLDKGTLNGVKLTASLAEVKKAFPCPNSPSVDHKLTSLYFDEHSFMFVPGRSISVFVIEDPFPGTMSKNVMGKTMDEVSKLLGNPAHRARQTADAEMGYAFTYEFYPRPWGTLIVKYDYYSPAHVEGVTVTTQKLAELKKQYP